MFRCRIFERYEEKDIEYLYSLNYQSHHDCDRLTVMIKRICILWFQMCPLLRTYLYITWTKRRFIMSYTFLTVKKSNFLLTSCRFVVGVLIIHTSNHQLNHCHAVAQNLYSQNNHLGMTCSKWIKTIYTKNVSTITMLDNWPNYIRSTF